MIVAEHFVHAQHLGLAHDRILPVHELRLLEILGLLQFFRAHRSITHRGEFLFDFDLRVRRLNAGTHLRRHDEQSRIERSHVVAGADIDHHLLFDDQLFVQPRALPIAQNFRRHFERVTVGAHDIRHVIRLFERRQIRRMLQLDAPRSILRWLEVRQWRRLGAVLDPRKCLADQLEHLVGVEIADRHDQRVLRRVINFVIRHRVVERQPVNVVEPSNNRPVIRMRDVRCRAHHLVERVLRIVFGAHTPFLEHDVLLLVEILGLEVAHPIGFERDRHVDMILVDRLEVIGEVRFRERVILAAVLLDYLRELFGPQLLGALEHQMLAQMRQTGPAELLVARADAVKNIERRQRRLVILEHQHAKPVGQRLSLDRIRHSRSARAVEAVSDRRVPSAATRARRR